MEVDALSYAPRRVSPGLSSLSSPHIPKLDWQGAMTRLTQLASKKQRRAILSGWAVFVDLAAISAAFLIDSLLRVGSIDEEPVVRILVCILPICMGVALKTESQHVTTHLNGFKRSWRAVTSIAFSTLPLSRVAFFLK